MDKSIPHYYRSKRILKQALPGAFQKLRKNPTRNRHRSCRIRFVLSTFYVLSVDWIGFSSSSSLKRFPNFKRLSPCTFKNRSSSSALLKHVALSLTAVLSSLMLFPLLRETEQKKGSGASAPGRSGQPPSVPPSLVPSPLRKKRRPLSGAPLLRFTASPWDRWSRQPRKPTGSGQPGRPLPSRWQAARRESRSSPRR